MKPDRRQQSSSQPKKRTPMRIWIGIAIVVVLGGALALSMAGGSRTGGKLTVERTTHDFGQVKMTGGQVVNRFPLGVEGTPTVSTLITN